MTATAKCKTVSLTFRGFDVDPIVIERMIGVQASNMGLKGVAVKPGVKAVLKRSFVRFSVPLDLSTRLDQVVPAIFDHVGGPTKIVEVRDGVSSELVEVDIVWPVKDSEDQEGGFIPPSVLADLASMRCSLSFSFT